MSIMGSFRFEIRVMTGSDTPDAVSHGQTGLTRFGLSPGREVERGKNAKAETSALCHWLNYPVSCGEISN